MDNFDRAIRTTQIEGGGIYVEAKLAIGGEIYTYGQHYSHDPTRPTFAKNVPTAVKRFKKVYYPMYLSDVEAQL